MRGQPGFPDFYVFVKETSHRVSLCFSFYFVSFFLFRVCHSKTSFYWAGYPRPQEYRPRRRCEAGPAAPKPMAPGNDAIFFLWRHAADRRFGAAVDNTRRCRHPGAPAPEKTLRSLITSLKCGGTSFRHTEISQGWWVGVFLSVEGRPRARLCRLYWRLRCLLADAHNHTRNIPRGPGVFLILRYGIMANLVMSQGRNGPVWRPSDGALLFGT